MGGLDRRNDRGIFIYKNWLRNVLLPKFIVQKAMLDELDFSNSKGSEQNAWMVFVGFCCFNYGSCGNGRFIKHKMERGVRMGVLLGLTTISAIGAIEAFTNGAILGITLYVASRTNRINRRQPKMSRQSKKSKEQEKK